MVKIDRAKEHIDHFKAELATFLKSDTYSIMMDRDPIDGGWDFIAMVAADPPLRLGAIAGDAIHNLRSVLDIIFGIAIARSGDSSFPIMNPRSTKNPRLGGRIEGSRDERAWKLVRAANDYPVGNEVLWMLSELDNENKHRTLVPAYAMIDAVTLDVNAEPRLADPTLPVELMTFRATSPICPVEHGRVVFRLPATLPDAAANHLKAEFPLQITFGELEVVKHRSILRLLDDFAKVVEGVAESFIIAGLLD